MPVTFGPDLVAAGLIVLLYGDHLSGPFPSP
jgi:hypothetical protein